MSSWHDKNTKFDFFCPHNAQYTYTLYVQYRGNRNAAPRAGAKKGQAYSSLNLYSKHKAGRLAFYWALWAFACWLRCCLGISSHIWRSACAILPHWLSDGGSEAKGGLLLPLPPPDGFELCIAQLLGLQLRHVFYAFTTHVSADREGRADHDATFRRHTALALSDHPLGDVVLDSITVNLYKERRVVRSALRQRPWQYPQPG